MPLKFYYHPLSSFCWKVLIALYEKDAAFEGVLVNLGDSTEAAAFRKISPMGKMPALVDDDVIVNETSIEIEYLDLKIPNPRLIPIDPEAAMWVRFWDRFFDTYLHYPMQSIVGDRLRPRDKKDAFGVALYRSQLSGGLDTIDERVSARTFVASDTFSLADCAAGPALFYANKVAPFEATHPNAFRYLQRLQQRPSFARVLKEAEPFAHMFPREDAA
jgi:glutathione S-transferase